MDRPGSLQRTGWVPSALPTLVLQTIRDLEMVEESINEMNWVIYSSPPLVRALCIRGFRGKMGTSIKEWEAQTDFLLERARGLSSALVLGDEIAFAENAKEIIDNHAPILKMFKVLLVNLTSLPDDVAHGLREEENADEIDEMVQGHCRSVATLIMTLEMITPQLARYIQDRAIENTVTRTVR